MPLHLGAYFQKPLNSLQIDTPRTVETALSNTKYWIPVEIRLAKYKIQEIEVFDAHTWWFLNERTEAHIHYLAYYDSVHELPNRQYLARLNFREAAYSASKYSSKLFCGCFWISIDFKTINDSLGHNVGWSSYLCCVAHNFLLLSRIILFFWRELGGDEFSPLFLWLILGEQ